MMDALDGLLSAPAAAELRAHAAACPQCGPTLTGIERGMLALQSLEEVEPPPALLHNVLARTTFAPHAAVRGVAAEDLERNGRSRWGRLRAISGLRAIAQPRFAMSLGMAFFSVTLLLNVGGIKAKDLKVLRPSTLRTTAALKFYETEAHIVKYYENLRIVYEFESRYREIKNSEKPAPPGDRDKGKKNNDTSRLGSRPARDTA